VVGRFFNPFADRKLGHSEPLPESLPTIIPPIWLTHLKQTWRGAGCMLPW